MWMYCDPVCEIRGVHPVDHDQQHTCRRMVRRRVNEGLWVLFLCECTGTASQGASSPNDEATKTRDPCFCDFVLHSAYSKCSINTICYLSFSASLASMDAGKGVK